MKLYRITIPLDFGITANKAVEWARDRFPFNACRVRTVMSDWNAIGYPHVNFDFKREADKKYFKLWCDLNDIQTEEMIIKWK